MGDFLARKSLSNLLVIVLANGSEGRQSILTFSNRYGVSPTPPSNCNIYARERKREKSYFCSVPEVSEKDPFGQLPSHLHQRGIKIGLLAGLVH